jgi:hypothetical protein
MKTQFLVERRGPSDRAGEIVSRRRRISSRWSPSERGRRMLLAAARQVVLWDQIGVR